MYQTLSRPALNLWLIIFSGSNLFLLTGISHSSYAGISLAAAALTPTRSYVFGSVFVAICRSLRDQLAPLHRDHSRCPNCVRESTSIEITPRDCIF